MVLAEDLRRAVLQAALQGKLTKHLSNDSDASALYEKIDRIRAKKMKLGIVKNKIMNPVQEDEIPFDIPEHWVWVRLNNIFNFIDYRGKTPQKVNNGVRLIGSANIKMGYLDFSSEDKYISAEEFETRKSRGLTQEGDILFVTEGGSIGNVCLNSYDKECSCGQRVITLQSYEKDIICNKLFMYFIMSDYFQTLLSNKQTGSAATGIKGDILKTLVLPFPPIEEQKRIVNKINEIMPKIDEYEKIEKELDALKKQFPSNMKDALLQAAMQGKLSEQLESDSDVDELLEAIRKEKEKLIAQKKIKNEKPLPDIEEEEIPFDIPENWRWVRMGNIINLLSGQDLQSDRYSENNIGIPYLTGASNFKDGDLIINRYTSSGTSIAYNGDLLLTCKGTIGEMAFINFEKAHIARQIMSISKIGNMSLRYIKLCLENFILKLKSNARSIIPGIDRKVLLSLLVPIPPIEEQQRIVERLEALLPLCEDLKEV